MIEYIATFHTHFGAIKFARTLERADLAYKMMPVPRKLSSSCGTCVRFCAEEGFSPSYDEDFEGLYMVHADCYVRRES